MNDSLFTYAISGLFGVVVWFMKRTLDDHERRLTDLKKDNEIIRKEYLHKDDFKEFKSELRGMFVEIKDDIRMLRDKHV